MRPGDDTGRGTDVLHQPAEAPPRVPEQHVRIQADELVSEHVTVGHRFARRENVLTMNPHREHVSTECAGAHPLGLPAIVEERLLGDVHHAVAHRHQAGFGRRHPVSREQKTHHSP
ncbi:hypothetical protein [Lentzea sp. NPDC051838]|uniref:hypothetical protein n=1 Tax=Lentzea sp. NPDC051838 TaxID=3154849 RepID=UPI00342170CE